MKEIPEIFYESLPDDDYSLEWEDKHIVWAIEFGRCAGLEEAAQDHEDRIKTYGPQMNHYERLVHADSAERFRALKDKAK